VCVINRQNIILKYGMRGHFRYRWPLGGEGPESRLWRGIASEIERQIERGNGVWGFLTTSPSSGDERAAKRHGGAADRRRPHGSGARWRRCRAAERGASTAAAHGSGARWRRAAERGASTWGGGTAAVEVEAADRRAAGSGGTALIWWKPLAPGDKVTRYLRQP